jgi:glutathione S-transferase
LEQAKADAIVDTCDELLELQIRQIGNKKEVNDDELKQHLDRVEKVLELFKGEGEFSFGASLTWADLAVFDATSHLSDSQLTQYERIRRVRKSVEENQRISGYLKYRPTSPFIIPEAL